MESSMKIQHVRALDKKKWPDLAKVKKGDGWPRLLVERVREVAELVDEMADRMEDPTTGLTDLMEFSCEQIDPLWDDLQFCLATCALLMDGNMRVADFGEIGGLMLPFSVSEEEMGALKILLEAAWKEHQKEHNPDLPGQYL